MITLPKRNHMKKAIAQNGGWAKMSNCRWEEGVKRCLMWGLGAIRMGRIGGMNGWGTNTAWVERSCSVGKARPKKPCGGGKRRNGLNGEVWKGRMRIIGLCDSERIEGFYWRCKQAILSFSIEKYRIRGIWHKIDWSPLHSYDWLAHSLLSTNNWKLPLQPF